MLQPRLKDRRSRWRRYSPVCTNSPLFEIALVLVRFDHVASAIVNANDSIM